MCSDKKMTKKKNCCRPFIVDDRNKAHLNKGLCVRWFVVEFRSQFVKYHVLCFIQWPAQHTNTESIPVKLGKKLNIVQSAALTF